MSIISNLLWRPGTIHHSARAWAQATHEDTSLRPLKPSSGLPPDREWLLQLNGGKVIGDARLVASCDDAVIGQLQRLHEIENPANYWAVRQKRFRWTVQLPGISFLMGVGAGENYYHWLFEALPRLDYLRRAGFGIAAVDQFLINEKSLPFHHQTLELLHIPVSKRVHCSRRRVLECETLLVPPMPLQSAAKVIPWVCQFLRQSFLPACPTKEPRTRIYLSRRGSRKRRLLNEAAVEEFFSERGFAVVCPETLSFPEQVAMFAGANFVAGPHGAAFANLVFAPACTQVIEFFHPKHQIRLYEGLATQLGMRYRSMVGMAPGEQSPAMSEKLGPYTVELGQLQQLLDN